MTFGKPRQDDTEMRCIKCGAIFEDREATLHHAGRTMEGDFWNTECPNCGTYDSMGEKYAEMSDEEFKQKQHEISRGIRKAKRRNK